MERTSLNKVKIALLKRIDGLVWRCYHQTLSEMVNELYVRCLSVIQDPTADEIFALLHDNRVLTHVADPEARELRDAVERMVARSYGRCIECQREMSDSVLEKNPTQRYCAHCSLLHGRSYEIVLQAMKSVDVFPW